MDELADLGFDPALDDGPSVEDPEVRVGLAFTKCPFRELAVLYPDLVCELHRGLTEGILAGIAAGQRRVSRPGSSPSPAWWTPTPAGPSCRSVARSAVA